MSLVDYPDSEEDEVSNAAVSKLPALPSTFLDLYSSTVRTSTTDDPSLHGGRKRVIPHVEGNWPTHIYLEWQPSPADSAKLVRLLSPDQDVHSLLQNALGVALPLHVSLSRPLVLRTEQKADFLQQLERRVTGSRTPIIKVNPSTLKWHPNEDGSRSFLVIGLERSEALTRLLTVCNDVAVEHNAPALYDADDAPDSFHISIAWSLRALRGMVQVISEFGEIQFSVIKVRLGQDVHTIPLLQRWDHACAGS